VIMRPALILLLALLPAAAAAHGVSSAVTRDRAVIVTFTYADGAPLAFARARVIGPGDARPFAAGVSDRLGRVVFLPDRPGDWTVTLETDDGHGGTQVVTVGDGDETASDTGPGRTSRLLIALAVLAAITLALNRLLPRSRP